MGKMKSHLESFELEEANDALCDRDHQISMLVGALSAIKTTPDDAVSIVEETFTQLGNMGY